MSHDKLREEPSHPWARDDMEFDWQEERRKQHEEGPRWIESSTERAERERSILNESD